MVLKLNILQCQHPPTLPSLKQKCYSNIIISRAFLTAQAEDQTISNLLLYRSNSNLLLHLFSNLQIVKEQIQLLEQYIYLAFYILDTM